MTDSYEPLLAIGLGMMWATILIVGIVRNHRDDDDDATGPAAGDASA